MKAPSVSVIVPHFERPLLLAEALASASRYQAAVDEIIVVDDGSTPETVSHVHDVVGNYPLARLIVHDQNRGGAAARNTAVAAARNSWIFCLDSDNLLSPHLIDRLLRYAISEELDIAVPERTVFFEDAPSAPTHAWRYETRQVSVLDHIATYVVPAASGNYLYSARSWQSVGGYRPDSGPLDAWLFGLDQVAHGFRMRALASTEYWHRYGHASYWIQGRNKSSQLRRKAVTAVSTYVRHEAWYIRLQLSMYGSLPDVGRLPVTPVVWLPNYPKLGSIECFQ